MGKIAEKLQYIGFLGLLGLIYRPLTLFFLFFLAPGVATLFELLLDRNNRREHWIELQILLISLLNPFILYQTLCHSFGQLSAMRRKSPLPEEYSQKTEFRLPFEGFWTAENGGITKEESHSWEVINQRYAYDFLVKDESGKTHRGSGESLEDYYAYGKPILAPADGIVVDVRDGVPDNPPGRILWSIRDFRGNFVLIKHDEGEYSFLTHLKNGSVRVKPGQRVKRGEIIGLCGNSGFSTEPHLHFHVQDSPNFFSAVGLPVKFIRFYRKEDSKVVYIERDYIRKGWVVAPAE
ncbi:M23 family metallopeptidase [Thermococcus aciditolerans]|uniref:M23 family metallopeptidase n=1 Tax=Thermococcus aciditolerans TaxID=2598455 RepID=A0A5C0SHX9_9EURY|nr:M23 family metallopeptidase [Thermococcus aciditolerans]QEK13790.1 M23 family metallopeptidase [Thermococcus aciditolerans]